ncbi:MAG: L-histidine N(alpha)-methyltransferase [Alphaproteobacteria bacterium]|nr:L-histidine N(alpha)-methyltransferase [Alphaproteobacteria bacterium]
MTQRPETPPSRPISTSEVEGLTNQFNAVRRRSLELADPLSAEDQCIQSMPDVSPTKWHLAHTTWFFETFILKSFVDDYEDFHRDFGFLFNSYYELVGPRHDRPRRGLLSRPSLEDVLAYRSYVEGALRSSLAAGGFTDPAIRALMDLGCHHEQQHQELILTDIKHVLSCNPLRPAYLPPRPRDASRTRTLDWIEHAGGLVEIGHGRKDFAFDCEGPQHKVWLELFKVASRPVTNGEYLEFMLDRGYERPELWLSNGWAECQAAPWRAPLYWEPAEDGEWRIFTLSGLRPLDPDAPVCHVSFYEADAYARWAGKRLPTEGEWEVIATPLMPAGNFAGTREFHPVPARGDGLRQIYGDVWEWTASAYLPYPGFRPVEGAVGEYNGKFMSGQMVLRGGSCATPEGHVRPTYRNFFYPADRWQFSGIRLAETYTDARVYVPPVTETEEAKETPTDPATLAFLNDVVVGLSDNPKTIPPKWFYDQAGADLFQAICRLPEYYLTRVENDILKTAASAIAEALGPGPVLVEYGSGSMSKVECLLDRLDRPHGFVAIDISADQLEQAARNLNETYPNLHVHTIARDFSKPIDLPDLLDAAGRRCAFFPGSTIGNFEPLDARRFLGQIAATVGSGGALVIGVDLKKDKARLESAYDDRAGVTERFNKNLLVRINRELDGDANLDAFEHQAIYDPAKGRVEMHLRSRDRQTLTIAGHRFHFERGESIHTENSYKFAVADFEALARDSGFRPAQMWTDADELFAVFLLDAE